MVSGLMEYLTEKDSSTTQMALTILDISQKALQMDKADL